MKSSAPNIKSRELINIYMDFGFCTAWQRSSCQKVHLHLQSHMMLIWRTSLQETHSWKCCFIFNSKLQICTYIFSTSFRYYNSSPVCWATPIFQFHAKHLDVMTTPNFTHELIYCVTSQWIWYSFNKTLIFPSNKVTVVLVLQFSYLEWCRKCKLNNIWRL